MVAVIMGSKSDWTTMQRAAEVLAELGVPYEAKVVSAHRTPDLLFEYVGSAEARSIQVIIAGAGGAAHLPGMATAETTLPVRIPKGVPVGTLAIGEAGAANTALLATAVIALGDPALKERLRAYRIQDADEVAKTIAIGLEQSVVVLPVGCAWT